MNKKQNLKLYGNKLLNLGISVIGAVIIWVALIFLANVFANIPSLHRLFTLFGGSPNGYIQAVCYVCFIYALLDLRKMREFLKKQFKGFDLKLLPEEDQLILTPEEVSDIKLSIMEIEKRGVLYLVSDFIKKACTQYRNDQSIPETLQVLDVQINNTKDEMEGSLNTVRYLIGAIMSLGFIGTLIGLTSAIGSAHLAKTEEGMPILTSLLNIAFDTTLVALVLSLILNFIYHNYLELMDGFYARSRRYIIDNLISRIYRHI